MTDTTRIWLAVSYAEPFRTGGWAHVRSVGGAATGQAGGDRRIGRQRLTLVALMAALKDAPGDVVLTTADALLAAVPERLSSTGDEAPTEDLDLWAQVAAAFKARTIRIVRQAPSPGGPVAFTNAWAEQARERAKNGPFAFAIPKPNLAKAGV
ncbi:hypothetical protein LRS10_15375 [Phenylobacterium sp. J426]|uniref:hypothetical protein n=1 Tax=Phenylobacterium sp. J426 TaxID=2898439 RepID=UPI0021511BE2|nr:hypothetical protein [Phenylobacterium sp. J426]MCR5875442.1 hypothetical protein [Phenylobacterium sp. J426]